MNRFARALCSLQGGAFLWLAYCAVQSARNGATWEVWLFAAASVLPVIAMFREYELADERRAVAVRAERLARLRIHAEEINTACCERWWTSLATDHDPTCPNQTRRSAA